MKSLFICRLLPPFGGGLYPRHQSPRRKHQWRASWQDLNAYAFQKLLGKFWNYQEQVASSSKAQQFPIQHPLPRKTREKVYPKDLLHKLRKDRWGWVAFAIGKLLNHQEQITSSSKAQCFPKRGKNCHKCKACRNIHIVSPHCPGQVRNFQEFGGTAFCHSAFSLRKKKEEFY